MSSIHDPGEREQDNGWLPGILEEAPPEKDMDFTDSSFFQAGIGRSLPDPPNVDTDHQGILVVSEMRLLIKFGPYVTIDEAIAMRAVRKRLGHQVPVPEVFGWRSRQDRVLIYMELVSGTTLEERWDDLNLSEKDSLCEQLSQILLSLRQLKQRDTFIGRRFFTERYDSSFKSNSILKDLLLGGHYSIESFMSVQRLGRSTASTASITSLNGFHNDFCRPLRDTKIPILRFFDQKTIPPVLNSLMPMPIQQILWCRPRQTPGHRAY